MGQATKRKEGKRLPDFAEGNNLAVTNSFFQKAANRY